MHLNDLTIWTAVIVTATVQAEPIHWAWATSERRLNRLVIHEGEPPLASTFTGAPQVPVAWASFKDDIHESGWSYLQIESSPYVHDELQAYAAGALEAYLTRRLMENQWENLFSRYCENQTEYCSRLDDFIIKNLEYSREQEHRFMYSDPYWNMVHLQMKQLAGLSDVFENQTLDYSHELNTVTRSFYFSLVGDLFDLEQALERKKDFHSIAQILACSALVKVVGDFEDIYISHDTWFLYRGMLRIQKRYIFPWHYTAKSEHIIPGHTITMSSYAGKLVSWDNFYLTSAGLAITETSIVNDNKDLWKFVVPESGPFTWVSAAVASRLATSGLEWVRILGRENGGTCNSQVLVLDYKLFVPGTPISDGTLWIYEQLPKMTRYEDVSRDLRDNKYWASYNIAYFSDIFNISEQLPKVRRYGDYYTFENAPRAKIFRRDHAKVTDMSSMIKLMRYNDFKNDPLSHCNCSPPYNPTYAIAPRYDLIDPHGTYDIPEMYPRAVGGIDVKVTNYTLFASREFVGVSGPTWENQPPFQWSNSGFADSHVGHPDKWQFEPVIHKWAEPQVKWSDKLQKPTNSAASRVLWTVYFAQLYAASSVWFRQLPWSS
ncbi:putative phospholipase B-like 2 [Rhipicephalus sanguineus]|uniref:putative phospholipase B-like 2 n=1 Tax=Rhipicephalus sanguineus TaxID=34632 RepID=UPI0020C3C8F1|nr:putative phospholipase B-like 2 [Rhipicephalus sanguineus]